MARRITVGLTKAQWRLVLECIGQMTAGNAYDAGEYRKCTGGTANAFSALCLAEKAIRDAMRPERLAA